MTARYRHPARRSRHVQRGGTGGEPTCRHLSHATAKSAAFYNEGVASRRRSPEGAAGVPGGFSKASPDPPGLAFGGRVSPEKLAGGGWEERSELVQGWPVAKSGLRARLTDERTRSDTRDAHATPHTDTKSDSTSCVYSVIGSAASWPQHRRIELARTLRVSREREERLHRLPHCRIAKRLVIATSEPQERSLSRSASVKGSTEQRQRRACFFSSSGFGGRPRERLAPLVAAPAAAGDASSTSSVFRDRAEATFARAPRTYVRPLPKGSARFCLSAGSAKNKTEPDSSIHATAL